MKLIIAGSRELESYRVVSKAIDEFIKEHGPVTEIVSGTARGIDRLGEKYAKDHHIALRLFPANWDYFGKRAGYVRNEEMAKYADACLAVWDGKSKGTDHMIQLAQNYHLCIKVVQINS